MPNIKSAKKRVKVIEKKTAANRAVKSALRTQLKKFDAAVAVGSDSEAVYRETVSAVDSAVTKGIIHKNKAARTKAQLAKKLAKERPLFSVYKANPCFIDCQNKSSRSPSGAFFMLWRYIWSLLNVHVSGSTTTTRRPKLAASSAVSRLALRPAASTARTYPDCSTI